MTELKLNKHLGGERPRDSPGGPAAPPVPARCPDGTGTAAPGNEGGPKHSLSLKKKKSTARSQIENPKEVKAIFPIENIF